MNSKIKEVKVINDDGTSQNMDIGANAHNVDMKDGSNVEDRINALIKSDDKQDNSIQGIENNLDNINNKVDAAVSGSPAGVYDNLQALITADPDHNYIYITTDNGNWNYWNGVSFVSGGVYQGTKIVDNSVDINNLSTNVRNIIKVEKPSITFNQGYIQNGQIIIIDSFQYSNPIKLQKGETFYFKAKGFESNVDVLSSCNGNGGDIKRLIIGKTELDNYKYTATSDTFVILCSKKDSLNYYYIDKSTNDDKVIGLTNNLKNVPIPSITDGKYISNTGFEYDLESYATAEYIEIIPLQKYIIKNINWVHTDNAGYAFYDKNKAFISYVQLTPNTDIKFTAPENSKYIRFTLIKANKDITKLIIDTDFNKLANDINNIDKINPEPTTKEEMFFNSFLKFGALGDSLSSGEAVSNNGTIRYIDNFDYSWGQFIARNYGMSCINFSKGGLTTRSWLETQLDKLKERTNKCNAYTICLGTNDYNDLGSSYLGSESDIKSDFNDNADTFYGNYGKIISNIKLVQPKAKIFILTIVDQSPSQNGRYEEFNNAIRKIATLFDNVYLVDIQKNYRNDFIKGIIYDNSRYGHYNAIGYNAISRIYYKAFSKIINQNMHEFNQIEFIGTDYSWN